MFVCCFALCTATKPREKRKKSKNAEMQVNETNSHNVNEECIDTKQCAHEKRKATTTTNDRK